jgi:hypothetical protein
MSLFTFIGLGRKALEKLDDKTVDKVAEQLKKVDPGAIDKVLGKTGKVIGEERAQSLAARAKGALKAENVDKLAGQAKGLVAKKADKPVDKPAAIDDPRPGPPRG